MRVSRLFLGRRDRALAVAKSQRGELVRPFEVQWAQAVEPVPLSADVNRSAQTVTITGGVFPYRILGSVQSVTMDGRPGVAYPVRMAQTLTVYDQSGQTLEVVLPAAVLVRDVATYQATWDRSTMYYGNAQLIGQSVVTGTPPASGWKLPDEVSPSPLGTRTVPGTGETVAWTGLPAGHYRLRYVSGVVGLGDGNFVVSENTNTGLVVKTTTGGSVRDWTPYPVNTGMYQVRRSTDPAQVIPSDGTWMRVILLETGDIQVRYADPAPSNNTGSIVVSLEAVSNGEAIIGTFVGPERYQDADPLIPPAETWSMPNLPFSEREVVVAGNDPYLGYLDGWHVEACQGSAILVTLKHGAIQFDTGKWTMQGAKHVYDLHACLTMGGINGGVGTQRQYFPTENPPASSAAAAELAEAGKQFVFTLTTDLAGTPYDSPAWGVFGFIENMESNYAPNYANNSGSVTITVRTYGTPFNL